MARNHYIRITAAQWENVELRNKVIKDARRYAGLHPGIEVIIKKQVLTVGRKGYYVEERKYLNWSGEPQEWE